MKALLAALLLFSLPAFAEFKVPLTPNPVNDYANVLTPGGKERIAKSLVTLKTEVGAQVGVLIVNSLDGSTVEDASMKVAKNWGLGSQDRDDGVLVFVAVKDRKMRVEVGRGLEGILTDYYSKQITSGMKPYLKAGDYDGAILAATDGILTRIRDYKTEITSKSGATTTVPAEKDSGNGGLLLFSILALLGIGGLATAKYASDKRKREAAEAEARRIARQPPTAEQLAAARLMYRDLKEHAKKDPAPTRKPASEDSSSFATGYVAGSLMSGSSSSGSDDSGGGFGGFGGGDSGGGFSGSDFGGGGGDFGGGGSSDSF